MSHQEAIRKLSSLVQHIAHEYRGYLPHEGISGEFESANKRLSADTRTRLMHIEDAVFEACKIEEKFAV
jgi:hypothetical protein